MKWIPRTPGESQDRRSRDRAEQGRQFLEDHRVEQPFYTGPKVRGRQDKCPWKKVVPKNSVPEKLGETVKARFSFVNRTKKGHLILITHGSIFSHPTYSIQCVCNPQTNTRPTVLLLSFRDTHGAEHPSRTFPAEANKATRCFLFHLSPRKLESLSWLV